MTKHFLTVALVWLSALGDAAPAVRAGADSGIVQFVVQQRDLAGPVGRSRGELTSEEIKDFEDFVVWRLAGLIAEHDLPFQIYTGHARIQGSNPMLLVELINAHPKTKFVLLQCVTSMSGAMVRESA